MIIGANGTGKSTIVAGIILGCGGSQKLLSRSKDVSCDICKIVSNYKINIYLILDIRVH